jgi:HEAT repeat protein
MLRMTRAVPGLLPLLGHESPEVRLNAVRALASIDDKTAAEPISRLAGDPSWEVRNAVMQALGRLAASDRIHHLVEGLSDSTWWVRFSSAEGLHALGASGITELRKAAESHPEAFARDISLQVLQQHGIPSSTTDSRP